MAESDGTLQDTLYMAVAFNNNHFIYYHMDAQLSVGLGWTYFASPDYLVVQYWVHSMFFFILILVIQQGYMCIAIKSFLRHSGVKHHGKSVYLTCDCCKLC